MKDRQARGEDKPMGIFPLILLMLMIVVVVFLILVQNIDEFSDFFGGTTFKIIFDIALLAGVVLFASYLFMRSAEYHRQLKETVGRLQKSNSLLQVLNRIQESANARLDGQGLLDASLEAVMPLISSLGTIYILDEHSSRFVPSARYGTSTPLSELPDFGVGEGIVGMVARSGEPVEDRGEGTVRGPGMIRYALPIRSGNRVVGVMVAGTTRGDYSEEEKTLLQAVCEVLGNSLTNARLYNLTRRALDTTRKTQGYLEGFIHASPMGVMVLDERGGIMIINQEAQHYLGAQQQDVLGRNAVEILQELGEGGESLAWALRECYRERRSAQFTRPASGDPATQAVLVHVYPLFSQEGELIGAAATISTA